MKISIPSLFLILLAALPLTVAAAEPEKDMGTEKEMGTDLFMLVEK